MVLFQEVKVALSPFKFLFICFNDSPSKFLFLNAFYFILKVLFIVLTFWACKKNGLINKVRLISKFMTSQPGY